MFMVPATANAYYMQDINAIGFPAGILQTPFFSIENPEYINYGSMGAIGGHEIG
ncbi:Peptidase M13, partial [Linnemannia schmuckeri]